MSRPVAYRVIKCYSFSVAKAQIIRNDGVGSSNLSCGTKALSIISGLTVDAILNPTLYPTLRSGWAVSQSRSAGARAEGHPLDATFAGTRRASNNLTRMSKIALGERAQQPGGPIMLGAPSGRR